MAYVNQEQKKAIEPTIKAICKKYGMKATLAVRHHSTLVLNVASGPIDFLTPYNERNLARCKEQGFNYDYPPASHFDVNQYHFKDHFKGKALEFLTEVFDVMNKGNHDNSDPMTDYFDVGWYVDINIGRYNKPYIFTPETLRQAITRCGPPEAAPALTATPCLNCEALPGARIEEHTHTKYSYQFYVVVMAERTSRDEYLKLLDRAKELEGWYSRAFGIIPAGFAFKDRSQAELFVGNITPPIEPNPGPEDCPKNEATNRPKLSLVPKAATTAKPEQAAKLRLLADKMQGLIDSAFSGRLTNTPKRMAQAMGARCEGEQLLRTQKALLALADLHDAGTVPPILARFTTKAAIHELMGSIKTMISNGYHGYYVCTGKPRGDSPETLALWGLLSEKSEEEKAKEALQRKIEGLQFSNIPGFFPTPDKVIDRMLGLAELEKDHSVLEPNLGSCAIADKIAELCIAVEGYEVNYTLAEICEAKGYLIERRDFLTVQPEKRYDRILMNPPFEKLQSISHIKHALKFLAPGGILVAICAGGPREAKELEPLCDSWEVLPMGSFKGSGTNVSSVLLTIAA